MEPRRVRHRSDTDPLRAVVQRAVIAGEAGSKSHGERVPEVPTPPLAEGF
jgi:hypothetical protein